MTLYSIIFGILFVGACKELFQTLLQKQWSKFSEAASVTLLIFNDALYTSHILEVKKVSYLIQMKLIDLVDFLLLSMAIVIIDPLENQLGIKSTEPFRRREPFFWSLLTIYWIFTLEWNRLAFIDELTMSYRIVQYSLLLILIAMSILTATWPSRFVTTLMRRCIPVLLLLYFVAYKPFVLGKR